MEKAKLVVFGRVLHLLRNPTKTILLPTGQFGTSYGSIGDGGIWTWAICGGVARVICPSNLTWCGLIRSMLVVGRGGKVWPFQAPRAKAIRIKGKSTQSACKPRRQTGTKVPCTGKLTLPNGEPYIYWWPVDRKPLDLGALPSQSIVEASANWVKKDWGIQSNKHGLPPWPKLFKEIWLVPSWCIVFLKPSNINSCTTTGVGVQINLWFICLEGAGDSPEDRCELW